MGRRVQARLYSLLPPLLLLLVGPLGPGGGGPQGGGATSTGGTTLATTGDTTQQPSCRVSQFFCNTGQCVALDRYCDGEDDCGDKSDEPRYCSRE